MSERRPVSGYEGIYEVDDVGNVHSLPRISVDGRYRVRARTLRPNPTVDGRPSVMLYRAGGSRRFIVARLVCRAFHGAPPSARHEAAHLNSNHADNRASNLAWKTHAENEADKIANGTDPKGSRNAQAVIHENDVPEIDALYAAGTPQRDIASRFGVNQPAISAVVNRAKWRHVPRSGEAEAAMKTRVSRAARARRAAQGISR